jgi:segregation and condensation protein B
MNEHYLRNVIEAALLAAGRPVQPAELIQLFDESVRPTDEQIRAAIDALAADYAERGIELKETASGVRVQVRREVAGEVSRLWPERPARYSRALLETLALIAYRQPITRGEIEGVRGVAVNPNIVKTLLERNWVRVVSHRDVPGRPELLGTTREFLDYFGLRSLDELPPLSELKAIGDINLQLDLQGDAAQPAKADGEAAQSAAAASEIDAGEPRDGERPVGAGDDEDDGDDGDELSAEGGEAHELVAAPRHDDH